MESWSECSTLLAKSTPKCRSRYRPRECYIPDIAFLNNKAAAKGDLDHIFRGTPDLAIEVVSESESALELRQKIQEYLDAGSKAVWAVYPKVRVIAVYDRAGVKELRADQILDAPEILPGFQARVDEFFG